MLKIAVIEDHTIFRIGLKALLNENFKELELYEVVHSEDYMEEMMKFHPDVIIIGLNPANRVNVFLLCEELRKVFPTIPFIVFDVIADYAHAIRFMRGQANGYLSKTDEEDELVVCIETLLSGKNYVCHEIQESIIKHMIQDKSEPDASKELSLRESEIANHISDGAKTSQIAKRLGLKSSTVSTIKSKIYTKLGVSNVIELRQKIKEGEN